jgi:uncharacterized protein YeaO (DUF488 family)
MTGSPSDLGPASAGILLGRIYDRFPDAATRILVDRLWPRGVRRESAPWSLWLKEAAPSGALRTWYHAHPEERATFRLRYREELGAPTGRAALERLAEALAEGPIVLLTARREVDGSHLPILAEALTERVAPRPGA